MIHSHNDYKAKIPFYTAYSYGAQIFEIDIVFTNKDAYVCHYPTIFTIGTSGKVEEYIIKAAEQAEKDQKKIWIYFDLKSGNLKLVDLIINYSIFYNSDYIKFLIGGRDKYCFHKLFQKRERLLKKILKRNAIYGYIELFSEFKKDKNIVKIDFY